jgi:hypothetical protein
VLTHTRFARVRHGRVGIHRVALGPEGRTLGLDEQVAHALRPTT